jgi:colanic acid/amylovoran biosynthesis glycosyltransferase
MQAHVIDRWWKPKATNLFAVLYAVTLISGLPFARALALLVPAAATIFGIGSVGHWINDRYDIEADIAVGKPNRLALLRPSTRRARLIGALALALVPWSVLPWNALSAAMLVLEFALLLAYAVPPLRLKERRVWPILADAAYAYAVPAVLAAHTFFLAAGRRFEPLFLGVLFAWQLALGVRHFLNHLALDRHNDLATRTPTLATAKGNRFIYLLVCRLVLPLEVTGFAAFLLLLGSRCPMLPLTFAAIGAVSIAVYLVLTVGRRRPVATYRFSRTHLDWLYQNLLPLVLVAFLVASDWRFAFLIGAHLLLFGAAAGSSIAREALAWRASLAPGSPSALATVGNALPDGARHAPAPSVRDSIAVVNINKHKYTETFVHGAVERLGYRVHYLHGGELPRFDDHHRHFLSNWPSIQALARLLESALGLETDHFLKTSIAGYLRTRRVRLLLAHFGPVGAQMLPIARDLGIPLIVCFHGYDVFHAETLHQSLRAYRTLFAEADRLIAVSEVMIRRLHDLGAPPDKLIHLPAFVDLARFGYSDHSSAGRRFLAVGRFAETKSPHLTILAFQRVAERVPDATLTMIGKGGGGELLEACVILARSLGLEQRVEFKGVLSHEQVAAEMSRARVFVQHSVTTPEHGDMEGKPVAVMEAMASGLPVVSTRHSGIVELIEDGVTGFLVDEYDVEAMAAVMLRLAADDALVKEVGLNASRRIHGDPLIRDHVRILEAIIAGSIARN